MQSVHREATESRELYLDLMKRCLTFYIWGEPMHPLYIHNIESRPRRYMLARATKWLARRNIYLTQRKPFDPVAREEGTDHPVLGHTMIGLKRLTNLQHCIEDVLTHGVPGDLIETGVWRGGATIFMRAVLKAYSITDRTVWVADSFMGLPAPNPVKYPMDSGDKHYQTTHLAVSLDEVKSNFASYGLLDDQVQFLKGWFKDTLPGAPIQELALLRLDGDMYESTIDALVHLYPKLAIGGYVIVDDYGYAESCKQAVHDYRASQGISDEIKSVDWSGVYWQRTG